MDAIGEVGALRFLLADLSGIVVRVVWRTQFSEQFSDKCAFASGKFAVSLSSVVSIQSDRRNTFCALHASRKEMRTV